MDGTEGFSNSCSRVKVIDSKVQCVLKLMQSGSSEELSLSAMSGG